MRIVDCALSVDVKRGGCMKKRTVLVVFVVLAVILVALSYEGIRGRYQQVTQESQEWAEYQ